MCNKLHMFGHNCGSQIVMKIGRNIFSVLDAISHRYFLKRSCSKLSTLLQVSQLFDVSLYSLVISVPDPFCDTKILQICPLGHCWPFSIIIG